jgi:hypothetical protein
MIVAQALAGIVSGAINDGGYTYGEWGLNDGVCKHGGSAVTSSSGCQTLATLISGVTVSPVNDGTKPKGCYSNYNSNGFYFNSHATGAAHGGLRAVCSGGDLYGEPMCSSTGTCYVAKTASSSACVAGSSPITSWADCDTAEIAIKSPSNLIDAANQLTPTVMDQRTTLEISSAFLHAPALQGTPPPAAAPRYRAPLCIPLHFTRILLTV